MPLHVRYRPIKDISELKEGDEVWMEYVRGPGGSKGVDRVVRRTPSGVRLQSGGLFKRRTKHSDPWTWAEIKGVVTFKEDVPAKSEDEPPADDSMEPRTSGWRDLFKVKEERPMFVPTLYLRKGDKVRFTEAGKWKMYEEIGGTLPSEAYVVQYADWDEQKVLIKADNGRSFIIPTTQLDEYLEKV